MADFFPSLVQAIFLIAVMVALTAGGIYAMKRFRGRVDEEEPVTSDMITNFREMHVRGELSDEEYRTIRTVLATNFQRESRDSGHDD